MSFFNINLKRQRIGALVKSSIKPGTLNDEKLSTYIKHFSMELPIFFFDTVGDGNITGLVLASLLENEILEARQIDASGYTFIKFTAEMDTELFEKSAPRVFEYVKSMELLNPYPGTGGSGVYNNLAPAV